MNSYEEATKRPHGYLMLDLKPTTDDQHRLNSNVLPIEHQHLLKSNVLPKENTIGQQNLARYTRKRSYEQLFIRSLSSIAGQVLLTNGVFFRQ